MNGRLKFPLTLCVTIINQKCQNLLVSAKSKAGIDQRSTQITVMRKVIGKKAGSLVILAPNKESIEPRVLSIFARAAY